MMRGFSVMVAALLLGCVLEMPIKRPSKEAAAVLHPIERVAYSEDWRHDTTRSAQPGEWSFVVLRMPENETCATISASKTDVRFLQMLPMRLDTPSGEGGRTGTFYEVLPPRNAATCDASRYVLAEWRVEGTETLTFKIGSETLNVVSEMLPFSGPHRPFFVGMGNANLLKGHCPNAYCPKEAELGQVYAQLFMEHGIQPMQNWVQVPPIRNGFLDLDAGNDQGISFRQVVMDAAISGFIGFPRMRRYQDRVAYLRALERTVYREGLDGRAWVYAVDEPHDMDALIEELKLYRTYAPSLRILVTTDRRPELDPYVDVYAPVFNRLVSDSAPDFEDYTGKAVWSYMSCMGSCGPHRASKPDAEKVAGPDTGLPDLLIDRPASRLFEFFKTGAENGLAAGLHYEVVESYRMIPDGVDPTVDPWNFGGNGDGILVFPGTPGRYGLTQDAAIPSFRLKLLRYALQHYW